MSSILWKRGGSFLSGPKVPLSFDEVIEKMARRLRGSKRQERLWSCKELVWGAGLECAGRLVVTFSLAVEVVKINRFRG